jgi:hypothetical protein
MPSFWNGDHFIDSVRDQFAQNITGAGELLRDKMKQAVDTPYPPPSSPGEPPHRRTGGLQQRITTETTIDGDQIINRTGAPGMVAFWLETGTRGKNGSGGMKPRPFARRTLLENLGLIRDRSTQGFNKTVGEAA